jgi:hypothetical protein
MIGRERKPEKRKNLSGKRQLFVGHGFTGCGKTQSAVILSEAKNLSLFLFLYLNRREILRIAQNDKTRHFVRTLFSHAVKHAEQMRLERPRKSSH